MKRIFYLLITLLAAFGCTCNTGNSVKQSEPTSESPVIKEKYAVVVGVYRQKEPAEGQVQKCEAKGYKATIIPHKSGLFAVVVCPADSKEEALMALEKAMKDGVCSDEGWILTIDSAQ